MARRGSAGPRCVFPDYPAFRSAGRGSDGSDASGPRRHRPSGPVRPPCYHNRPINAGQRANGQVVCPNVGSFRIATHRGRRCPQQSRSRRRTPPPPVPRAGFIAEHGLWDAPRRRPPPRCSSYSAYAAEPDWIARHHVLLRGALAADTPVLGVCFGAQASPALPAFGMSNCPRAILRHRANDSACGRKQTASHSSCEGRAVCACGTTAAIHNS